MENKNKQKVISFTIKINWLKQTYSKGLSTIENIFS